VAKGKVKWFNERKGQKFPYSFICVFVFIYSFPFYRSLGAFWFHRSFPLFLYRRRFRQ